MRRAAKLISRIVGLLLLLISAAAVFFMVENAFEPPSVYRGSGGYHYGAEFFGDIYGIGECEQHLYLIRWTSESKGGRYDYLKGYSSYGNGNNLRIFAAAQINELGFIPPQEITHYGRDKLLDPQWVVGAPLWFVATIFGIPGIYITWRSWNMSQWFRRRKKGHCAKCGYDIRESKSRCPECGTEIPAAAATPTPPAATPPKLPDAAP